MEGFIYNGINLAGIDIANLYKEYRRNPLISLPEFISKTETYWKILVPNKGIPLIMKSYPWLASRLSEAVNNPSWEISMSPSGIPLKIEPNDKKVKYGNMGFQIYQNTSASNNAIIEQSASGEFLRLITNGGSLS